MEDIIGKKFGKLTVLKLDKKDKFYRKNKKFAGYIYYYLCKCDCGNFKIINGDSLKRNITKSCGCLRKSLGVKRAKNNFVKHNLSRTRIYRIYYHIKQRCYNVKLNAYEYYGKRGIKVCQEWLDDFMNFYNWAMSNGYNDNLSIDRINVNGNYEPSNCRWVDMKTQANNKTNSIYIKYKNKQFTLSEFSEKFSLNKSTIRSWHIRKNLKEKLFNLGFGVEVIN